MHAEISNIQRLCTHDGPGIRTTVFLTGCPLRCWWCHNPENRRPPFAGKSSIFYTAQRCVHCGACQAACPQALHQLSDGEHLYLRESCTGCGQCAAICPTRALEPAVRQMTIEAILAEVERDRPFYGSRGGMTLSGGEPTVQADAAFALLEGAHALGITTALETCGFFPAALCARLTACVDLFLFDVKATDPTRHLQHTGAPLEPILANLRRIDALGGTTHLRCILIRGVNDTADHAARLALLFHELKHCLQMEILPYHSVGASKWARLGLVSRDDSRFIPTPQEIAAFEAALRSQGVQVKPR